MYYPDCLDYENLIEEICYDQQHIENVWDEMYRVIPVYFEKYITSDGGHALDESELEKLAAKFGSTAKPKLKTKDVKKILSRLLKEAIDDFENERDIYKGILNPESLAEYKHDVNSFKNTVLKNQIPIIRKTLQNKKAKELDKFRAAFNGAQPGNLFDVTSNIVALAIKKRNEWYNEHEFENINSYNEIDYDQFDEEGYTAYGVIGGGIKSQFMYQLFPEMYPSRSREAVWALFYLSSRKEFGCRQNSPFLMINPKEGSTQQNYFYPYGLFSFYALRIYKKLKELYAEHEITLPIEYRFVVVNSFLSFVSRKHQAEIDLLKQKSENVQYDH